MAKVLLDYGHGGTDPGAVYNGLKEKDINFKIGQRVKSHLERHGVEVIESRYGDTNPPLTERSNKANVNNVIASISFHCNASESHQAKGMETYTYGRGINEIKLANCVHYEIIRAGLYNIDRGIKQANLHMVREPAMAAILIELGFIDNIEDANLLKNKSEEFSLEIAKGILKYLNIPFIEEGKNTDIFYRVIVGSYKDKNNAELQQKKLKEVGFDSFLEVYKK
ncbi:MAG: N-acetylmuramoyl-L-alanine amidase [Fusobacterium necrophorum]|nr:N-acetylmuramoyl-L-alanine amidase [Fusobacterium necrophorum]